MCKYSEERFNLALANAKASLAIEGLDGLSPETEEILKKHFKGEISEKEMFKRIDEHVKKRIHYNRKTSADSGPSL